MIAALRRIKRLVPSDVMISLYKACVLSHIEYKPKRSEVVRDTLMAIGKAFKKGATKVVKKAAKGAAEKAGKNLTT